MIPRLHSRPFAPIAVAGLLAALALPFAAGTAGAQSSVSAISEDDDDLDPDWVVNPPDPNAQGVTWPTPNDGAVGMRPVKGGALILTTDDATIYVDPLGGEAIYERFPAPDVILVTSGPERFDPAPLSQLGVDDTQLVIGPGAAKALPPEMDMRKAVLPPGDEIAIGGVTFEAVPARPADAQGQGASQAGGGGAGDAEGGTGYVLTIDGLRVYIAGLTGATPEMRKLQNIHVALLPVNRTGGMTVDEAVDAVAAFQPNLVYPYRYPDDGTSIEFERRVQAEVPGVAAQLAPWRH